MFSLNKVTNSNNYVNLCYSMFRYIEQMFNKLERMISTLAESSLFCEQYEKVNNIITDQLYRSHDLLLWSYEHKLWS